MPESRDHSPTKKDVKDLKRENAILRKELGTSKKEIKSLHQRLMILENQKKREGETNGSLILHTLPELKSDNTSELKLDSDDDYVQSWQILGHHFSEVIRRHHEVLAEKDRQIRDLQDRRCFTRESPINPSNYSIEEDSSTSNSDADREKIDNVLKHYETSLKDLNEAGPSGIHRCAGEQCECNCKFVLEESKMISSGESLREHFNEVMRRHKQQLLEKDFQIQELQEALECFLGGNTQKKTHNQSEVQLRDNDFHDFSNARQLMPASAKPARRSMGKGYTTDDYNDHSDATTSETPQSSTTSPSDEDEGSSDTFVVIDKCQRLESIANLERLRQNLIKRLETEEKLDQLYWKKELSSYQQLCDQDTGDLDPNSVCKKDFELFKTTRFELLKALRHVKEDAQRGPEMYVVPHLPQLDSKNVVKHPGLNVTPESNSRRISFIEEVKITTLQTKYDK